jgi:hypothetical protein
VRRLDDGAGREVLVDVVVVVAGQRDLLEVVLTRCDRSGTADLSHGR